MLKNKVFGDTEERESEIVHKWRKATRKLQRLNQRLKIFKLLLMEMKEFIKVKLKRENKLLIHKIT